MYLEVTEIPALDARQQALLQVHSLLNLYNVIRAELMQLGLALADDPFLLGDALGVCQQALAGVADGAGGSAAAKAVEEHEPRILLGIDAELRRRPRRGLWVSGTVASLRSLLAALVIRARELRLRQAAKDPWINMPVAALEADFRDVFAAMERNSHGRFRIVFNPAIQRPDDYLLELAVDPANGSAVLMPAEFTDVIRDLAANSRKYTPPGGRIRISLRSNAEGVRLLVEDNGRGIPAPEIPAVVHFGVRGSNVSEVRTMGGGFGLTKAYVVTKRFGGRFWIDSIVGEGTKVRIHLPPRAVAVGPTGNVITAVPLDAPRFPMSGRRVPGRVMRRRSRPRRTRAAETRAHVPPAPA